MSFSHRQASRKKKSSAAQAEDRGILHGLLQFAKTPFLKNAPTKSAFSTHKQKNLKQIQSNLKRHWTVQATTPDRVTQLCLLAETKASTENQPTNQSADSDAKGTVIDEADLDTIFPSQISALDTALLLETEELQAEPLRIIMVDKTIADKSLCTDYAPALKSPTLQVLGDFEYVLEETAAAQPETTFVQPTVVTAVPERPRFERELTLAEILDSIDMDQITLAQNQLDEINAMIREENRLSKIRRETPGELNQYIALRTMNRLVSDMNASEKQAAPKSTRIPVLDELDEFSICLENHLSTDESPAGIFNPDIFNLDSAVSNDTEIETSSAPTPVMTEKPATVIPEAIPGAIPETSGLDKIACPIRPPKLKLEDISLDTEHRDGSFNLLLHANQMLSSSISSLADNYFSSSPFASSPQKRKPS